MNDQFRLIESLKQYLADLLKEGSPEIREYVKSVTVTARQGTVGEKISTVMANGLHETDNTVCLDEKTGKPGWIVENPGGEKYIVSDSVFTCKYEETEGEKGVFRPKGKPVLAAQVGESISFVAPWGERLNLAAGGYAVLSGKDDFYGCQKEEFEATYKMTEKTKAACIEQAEEMLR